MYEPEEFKFEIWHGGKIVSVATDRDIVTAHRNATHLAVGYALQLSERMLRRDRWMRRIWLWLGATNKAASGVVILRRDASAN